MGFKRKTVEYEIDCSYGDVTVTPNGDWSVHIKQSNGCDDDIKPDLVVISRKNIPDLINILLEIENNGEDS